MIIQIPHDDGTVAVYFRLIASIWADTVHLVGDFNRWSTSATPMRRGEQYWEATVTLPAGSSFYYAYLLDGKDWRSEYGEQSHAVDQHAPPIHLIPIEIQHARRHTAMPL